MYQKRGDCTLQRPFPKKAAQTILFKPVSRASPVTFEPIGTTCPVFYPMSMDRISSTSLHPKQPPSMPRAQAGA